MGKGKKQCVVGACLLLVLALLGERIQLLFFLPSSLTEAAASTAELDVILDPGHGGIDGGCVGLAGTLEKELNLIFAQHLYHMLSAAGLHVGMTRNTDVLVLTEEQDIAGKRKFFDLRNRVEMAKAEPDAIFFSIHMNAYPERRYHGFQVYYAPNSPESEQLAEGLQSTVCQHLQTDNKRKQKEADSSIYVLDNAPGTAVLVECGFLSNPEEEANLSEPSYQKRLCFLLFCAMMK